MNTKTLLSMPLKNTKKGHHFSCAFQSLNIVLILTNKQKNPNVLTIGKYNAFIRKCTENKFSVQS